MTTKENKFRKKSVELLGPYGTHSLMLLFLQILSLYQLWDKTSFTIRSLLIMLVILQCFVLISSLRKRKEI